MSRPHRLLSLCTLLLFLVYTGCGNEDIQRPIKQFQDASAVVIAAARVTYQGMNDIEENAELNREIFSGEQFDETKIKAVDVITSDELSVRVNALNQLSRYTSALADLAALKAPAQVTQKFQDVGAGFTTVATDASKLVNRQGSGIDNTKLSGVVNVVSAGIGAVVRAIEEHRARKEIEKQIRDHDADVQALTKLLGDELEIAYQRRISTERNFGNFLRDALETERRKPNQGDPVLRMLLGEHYRDWRARQPALANADPRPAIDAMQKAHAALVTYLSAEKGPKSLSELYAAAESFFDRVQPLGQAIAALIGK
jgi:hypothetical protein